MKTLYDLFNMGYLGPISDYGQNVHPKTGKPIIRNPDGSISTERTMTFNIDDKHYVMPSIFNRVQYSPETLYHLFRLGLNKPVGMFDTEEEADNYARQRSKYLGY